MVAATNHYFLLDILCIGEWGLQKLGDINQCKLDYPLAALTKCTTDDFIFSLLGNELV
jgi:hypothetical protein